MSGRHPASARLGYNRIGIKFKLNKGNDSVFGRDGYWPRPSDFLWVGGASHSEEGGCCASGYDIELSHDPSEEQAWYSQRIVSKAR